MDIRCYRRIPWQLHGIIFSHSGRSLIPLCAWEALWVSLLFTVLSQVDSLWSIPSYFFRQACVRRTLSGAREVDALLEQTVDCCCQKHMHIYILLHGLYIYFSRIFRTQCGHNLGWMHNGDHMMNHKWKLLVGKKIHGDGHPCLCAPQLLGWHS